MRGRVHSIESFGTVDGPGVRYVVFLQGCSMRCLYCHNPDTWEYDGGKWMTVEEILTGYDKVKNFLKNGGLTVTGGEPLLQIDFVLELMTEAKKRGIHTCIDTSGITFVKGNEKVRNKFDRLLEVTDLFMLDIKHIDEDAHKQLTAQSNGSILAFAEYLSEKGKDVWIRHVVVPGYTDKQEELERLGYFIGGIKNIKALDVLPYHTMGNVKYESMGKEAPLKELEALSKEDAIIARNHILQGIKRRLREEVGTSHR